MNPELQVQAADEYSGVVEEQLAGLLPLLEQDKVTLAPVQSLRDPLTAAGIIVSIVGTVGPVLIREIFKTIRQIVRDSHDEKRGHKKPVRAVINHHGRQYVVVTGDERFEEY
jgi:hypothetical protein